MQGIRRRTWALGVAAMGVAAAGGGVARAADADAATTKRLHAFFERYWDEQMRTFPEWATWNGDLRFNDRLTDASLAAVAAWDARERELLVEARAFPRDGLAPVDRVSLDLLVDRLERHIEEQRHDGWRFKLFGALGGAQTDFSSLVQAAPVDSVLQVEQLLKRMERYPVLVEQQLAQMRRAKALGWVPSRDTLQRVLRQIDDQVPAKVEDGPFYLRFRQIGGAVPVADRERLQGRARELIASAVVPALLRMRAFAQQELLPVAPADGAIAHYPDGPQVYAMLVKSRSTTDLAPAEIHAIGLRELARIRAEMDGIRARVKFDGDFAAFVKTLHTNPQFFHASPEAMLSGYRDIAKRLDAEMPRLFAELPRAPYGVKAMPAHLGPNAAEYYEGPAQDGSRGGTFFANVAAWKQRPKWTMPTLVLHEAVPGHHLQVGRAVELRDLPRFRRGGGYVAYVEGWGVYAETLGRDIGFYEDPYDLFGHLQWQALRAARLVVDTGIHAQGWSRERAIAFLVEQTGMDPGFLTQEVDRYTSNPGQALGYMLGKLKIEALRERARAALGAKFDLRRFHNAVLDQGALPLPVLEKSVEAWIAAEMLR